MTQAVIEVLLVLAHPVLPLGGCSTPDTCTRRSTDLGVRYPDAGWKGISHA